MPVLYIGNKNYSSWSLRPWLALKWANVAFEERVIQLGGQGYGRSQIPEVRAVSPSGRVPALEVSGTGRRAGSTPALPPSESVVIWDSLAICEWAAENAPAAHLWPEDPMVRAVCRSVACEMHSSFAAVRRDMSMNIRRRTTPRDWPQDTRDDLVRIEEVWTTIRARYGAGGPFLFGARTIADAFYAPVVTRFRTYGVPLSASSAGYSEAVLADPSFREWEAAGVAEPWTLAQTDAL